MTTLPLKLQDGHLFIELNGELWLLDTGAPTSFGTNTNLALAGESFRLGTGYLGLNAASLSRFVGVQCVGLLGADVLGRFDIILDVPQQTITLSTSELSNDGQPVPFDEFMGLPIITARVGGTECRMFFDTGAQVSYLQDDSLTNFPPAGQITDFYPGVGQFQTDTYTVEVCIGASTFSLRCGSLPDLLGMTLMMAGTQGIIGNQILQGRRVGYFPRRKTMILWV